MPQKPAHDYNPHFPILIFSGRNTRIRVFNEYRKVVRDNVGYTERLFEFDTYGEKRRGWLLNYNPPIEPGSILKSVEEQIGYRYKNLKEFARKRRMLDWNFKDFLIALDKVSWIATERRTEYIENIIEYLGIPAYMLGAVYDNHSAIYRPKKYK